MRIFLTVLLFFCWVQAASAEQIIIHDGVDFSGMTHYKDDGVTKIKSNFSFGDRDENTVYRADGKTVHWKLVSYKDSRRKIFEVFDTSGNKVLKRVLQFKASGEVGTGETTALIKQSMELTVEDAAGSYTQFWEYGKKDGETNLAWHMMSIERKLKNARPFNKKSVSYEIDPSDKNKVIVRELFGSKTVLYSDLTDEEKQMFAKPLPDADDPSAPK